MRHAESTTADTARARPRLRDTYLRAQTAHALEAFEYEHVSHIALVGHSVRAEGDPHRVRQIVRNLISNARRIERGPRLPARRRRSIFELTLPKAN